VTTRVAMMSEVGRAKTLVVDAPRTVRTEHHTPRGSLLWLAGEKPVRNRPRRHDTRLTACWVITSLFQRGSPRRGAIPCMRPQPCAGWHRARGLVCHKTGRSLDVRSRDRKVGCRGEPIRLTWKAGNCRQRRNTNRASTYLLMIEEKYGQDLQSVFRILVSSSATCRDRRRGHLRDQRRRWRSTAGGT
jgi:hypothetical protein